MDETQLVAFYTEHHHLHNPSASHERPERAVQLLKALEAEPLAKIEVAADFGLTPILAVHTQRLVDFQTSAFARFAQLDHGPRPAVPDSFAVRELAGTLPRNVWGQLGYFCSDAMTPILERTWDAVFWSAQTALSAAHAVAGAVPMAYALCRPPGHHASADMYGGYCYLNNAAIAAEWLSSQGKRVAILDTDYHHGNGTQSIFYERNDVLVVSLHADPNDEYPYFCGYSDERGAGAGEGFNLNIPLPLGTTEVDYLSALELGLTAVDKFEPDVVIVSQGFDTLAGDPEGHFRLEVDSYQRIGRKLRSLGRPLVVIQEGGYLLLSLQQTLTAFLDGLLH